MTHLLQYNPVTGDYDEIDISPGVRAQYDGGAVTIVNGVTEKLIWENLSTGTELLDLSDPEAPTVIDAGVYSVTVSVAPNAPLTDGGVFRVILNLDDSNDDANAAAYGYSALVVATSVSVSLTYYIPAGGEINVQVSNYDGASSRDFFLSNAVIQRLSGSES